MADQTLLKSVDGKAIPCPSQFDWGLQDISNAEAGRDQTAKMYKNRIAQKVKISLSWNGVRPDKIKTILQAFQPEYVMVEYFDPLEGEVVTKEFYTGDKTAPVNTWSGTNKLYTNVSFNIIER